MNEVKQPWVSFCISTYKRPQLLQDALTAILKQTYQDFEVVISDNDPDSSAAVVVKGFNESRFKYFPNQQNLGMIPSFNKSIERAGTDYIVMITDDDPVSDNFLEEMFRLYSLHPGYSVYAGFLRKKTRQAEIEIIDKDNFITEILDLSKTPWILWSSCVLKRQEVLTIGMIPGYTGTHLADHAMIAKTGSLGGGVVINKMYSVFTSHKENFSKSGFHNYPLACKGFYENMTSFCQLHKQYPQEKKVLTDHLGKWFIANIFTLKKFYTIDKKQDKLAELDQCAAEIIALPFMRRFAVKLYLKAVVFKMKNLFGLLK